MSQGGRAGQLASSGLRPGWTTGACATAAARAAYVALRTGTFPDPVTVTLPRDRTAAFALTDEQLDGHRAMAAVTKDAGDDPDVTHGAVVRATVAPGTPGSGLTFAAGPGVGTVTLPGLPLALGEPAINPMPRTMITENIAAADRALGGDGSPDLQVTVGIDGGADLATHTLNPRLGIIGGLSVLGTTGIVVPYSCSAWIDSIRRGIDVAEATGQQHVAACTGSSSEALVTARYELPSVALLDMGDFVGAVLKYLRHHPRPRLTLCGGVGKFAKLADGHLDVHSARSRVDTGFLAGLAREAGAPEERCHRVATATTALGALAIHPPLGDAIAAAALGTARHVLRDAPIAVEVICIDRAGTAVGHAGWSSGRQDGGG
ncbi:cobalt-precorrin-5B (C1)-methyltransferase [Raineyella antarctica]|uniref:Cobalt-precorrin-5B C(1)-methyltransferase n=1 Tax=Raineyella antarctica TaxID=1577474 RepID=A0A1G6GD87_9ACTN|nr:cobalt-precorrin-5B (C(1))-methyltransferase [Raineyella antarctica]SDB79934.1 cobalt-precorrin-5B (C1)-methyltransferase [Raineyella antarctica]